MGSREGEGGEHPWVPSWRRDELVYPGSEPKETWGEGEGDKMPARTLGIGAWPESGFGGASGGGRVNVCLEGRGRGREEAAGLGGVKGEPCRWEGAAGRGRLSGLPDRPGSAAGAGDVWRRRGPAPGLPGEPGIPGPAPSSLKPGGPPPSPSLRIPESAPSAPFSPGPRSLASQPLISDLGVHTPAPALHAPPELGPPSPSSPEPRRPHLLFSPSWSPSLRGLRGRGHLVAMVPDCLGLLSDPWGLPRVCRGGGGRRPGGSASPFPKSRQWAPGVRVSTDAWSGDLEQS